MLTEAEVLNALWGYVYSGTILTFIWACLFGSFGMGSFYLWTVASKWFF